MLKSRFVHMYYLSLNYWATRFRFVVLTTCSLFTLVSTNGQDTPIQYTRQFSGESIQSSSDQKLIFLDFWATWCGPCIKVMPYVDYLNEIFEKDILFISISKESEYVIGQFLQNHTIESSVLSDYNGSTHRQFSVISLPKAVLLDNEGNLLWEGYPSQLSEKELQGYINQAHFSIKPEDVFIQKQIKSSIIDDPVWSFDIIETRGEVLEVRYLSSASPIPSIKEEEKNHMMIQGKLSYLVASLNKIGLYQVLGPKEKERYVRLEIKGNYLESDFPLILQFLKTKFNYKTLSSLELSDYWLFEMIDSSKFWASNYINYSNDMSPVTLLDEGRFEGDNLDFRVFCEEISNALECPVLPFGNTIGKYDWRIYIQYPDQMIEQLMDEYGIRAIKSSGHLEFIRILPN